MFRRHCRQMAQEILDHAQNYTETGHHVMAARLAACIERPSADEKQIWGGMVWQIPKQRFAETRGVYCEELQAEKERRQMDLLFLSLPEVPEASDFDAALEEIRQAITA